jgi:hypothetical protein
MEYHLLQRLSGSYMTWDPNFPIDREQGQEIPDPSQYPITAQNSQSLALTSNPLEDFRVLSL